MDPAVRELILNSPALEAPAGEVHNFDNPSNKNDVLIAVMVLCGTIPTILLVIRAYTKVAIVKKIGWDDCLLIIGWLMFIAYCVTTGFIARNGSGIHQWNLRVRQIIQLAFWTNASAINYGICVTLLKSSILVQYRVIFAPTSKKNFIWWSTHLLTFMMVIFYTVLTFAEIFECSPREKAWDVLIQEGTCLDRWQIITASGVFNVITDFLVLLIPQKIILKLQMPLKRKIAISGIFLIGLFACVTSILRLHYATILEDTHDISYHIHEMGLWTYAEIAATIVCACLPYLPKFLQSIRPSWIPSVRDGSSKTFIISWNRKRQMSIAAKKRSDPRDPYGLVEDSVLGSAMKSTDESSTLESRTRIESSNMDHSWRVTGDV